MSMGVSVRLDGWAIIQRGGMFSMDSEIRGQRPVLDLFMDLCGKGGVTVVVSL